jgi:hypothetical protein
MNPATLKTMLPAGLHLFLTIVVILANVLKTAAPTLELPKEITGAPGQLISIPALTNAASVEWNTPDNGASVDTFGDPKKAVFMAARAGRYRLHVHAARGGHLKTLRTVVNVTNNPNPGPGPVPPPPPPFPPPPPPPFPPGPVDPFVQTLQAAYQSCTEADKADLKDKLAQVYTQAASAAARPEVKTFGDLFDAMNETATALGLVNKLMPLQMAVKGHLSQLPTQRSAPLTDVGRTLASSLFGQVATALAQVK